MPVQLVTRHLECVQEAQPAPVRVGGRGVALELYVVHQVVVSKVQYAGGGLVVGVAVPLVGVGLVWDGAQVDDLVCEGGGSPLLHAQEAIDPGVQACVGRTQDGFMKKVPVYLCEGEGGGREREERERRERGGERRGRERRGEEGGEGVRGRGEERGEGGKRREGRGGRRGREGERREGRGGREESRGKGKREGGEWKEVGGGGRGGGREREEGEREEGERRRRGWVRRRNMIEHIEHIVWTDHCKVMPQCYGRLNMITNPNFKSKAQQHPLNSH